MGHDEFNLTLAATAGSVAEIRRRLVPYMEARCPDADARTIEAVRLAVSEACGNVVRHAYAVEHEGRLQVIAARRGPDLIVCVRDWGRGFGARARPGLGLGMPLMRELARSCDVQRGEGGGTVVTLVFACTQDAR
jgi:serine/threonine-protein kinase RsbW